MGASDDRNQSIAYLQLGWLHSKAECGVGSKQRGNKGPNENKREK